MVHGVPRKKTRRKLIFIRSTTTSQNTSSDRASEERNSGDSGSVNRVRYRTIIAEDLIHEQDPKRMSSAMYPVWFKPGLVQEELDTESSELQQETAEECLPFLTAKHSSQNPFGLPRLNRDKHVKFLRQSLGRLPAGFSALDASRPWILYWCLNGLATLDDDVTTFQQKYAKDHMKQNTWSSVSLFTVLMLIKDRLLDTLTPIQNLTGGFGGGHGQYSHLATTYAAILSIITVGGEQAYELIDRTAMWHWLGSLKQPEGDFSVCVGGERDVRGAYCAMVMLSLLDLPLELPPTSPARINGDETFLTGLAEWISRCQTYEGGISCAPGAEAHGAYAFCALACLCILDEPQTVLNRHLDLPALVGWLSARQHAPEGGLAGRTNKLVDGCYSHWIGGCWSLVEAAAKPNSSSDNSPAPPALWNRDGLIRYILCCCQAENGGLRDKPSKNPDAYHTNYNLVGLSSAQNYYQYEEPIESKTKSLNAPFHWKCSKTPPTHKSQHEQIFDEPDRVALVHPVFVVPYQAVEKARSYFHSRPLDFST